MVQREWSQGQEGKQHFERFVLLLWLMVRIIANNTKKGGTAPPLLEEAACIPGFRGNQW